MPAFPSIPTVRTQSRSGGERTGSPPRNAQAQARQVARARMTVNTPSPTIGPTIRRSNLGEISAEKTSNRIRGAATWPEPKALKCDRSQDARAVAERLQLAGRSGDSRVVGNGEFAHSHPLHHCFASQLGLDLESSGTRLDGAEKARAEHSVAREQVTAAPPVNQELERQANQYVAKRAATNGRHRAPERSTGLLAHGHVGLAVEDRREQEPRRNRPGRSHRRQRE